MSKYKNLLFAGALNISILASLAVSPAMALDNPEDYLFVPNRASNDVAVIDSKTDKVIAKINVGHVPHQVAVSKQQGKLIVTNTHDNTLSIVDLKSLENLATLTLDTEPEHMEMSADGSVLAVGNIGAGTVSLISLLENTEMKRISGLIEPHNMTFGPKGALLYVGNLGANFVSVIDVKQAKVINEIQVGDAKAVASRSSVSDEYQGIINVTRSVDGRIGFAAYGDGDRMAVIDLESQKKIKDLITGDEPWRAFSTANGKYMIVPNNGDETVSVFDTATLREVARLEGAADMTGVNTGWFDSTAFVISRGDNKAIVIDLDKMENVGEIALESNPETGVTTPDGRKLYIALSGTDRVAVIDTQKRKVTGYIDGVGEEPWGAHMAGAVNYCH
jgi:YVTN family beta-propeller protein